MYPISSNRSRRFVALLLALLTIPLAWSQQSLQVQEQHGVAFVSGGFGADERDQLRTMQDQFDFKLVFATDAGNYLGYVNVRIMDQQGDTLLETRSNGPILMADLPAGNYTVIAENKNIGKERTVSVGGKSMTEVTFTWPAH